MFTRITKDLPVAIHQISSRLRRTFRRTWRSPVTGSSDWQSHQLVWNDYARQWSTAPIMRDEHRAPPQKTDTPLFYLGDEWGRQQDVRRIVSEYIDPYVTSDSIVGEIGSGGGRISVQVAPKVKELHCFDLSSEMLKRAGAALAVHQHVHFHQLAKPHFGAAFRETFEFIYSFDVFVHLDLLTIWSYFCEIATSLRPGGKAFLHTTNLAAAAGWENFCSPRANDPTDHQFLSPEIVDIFALRSGLQIIKRSIIDPTNFYLNRDYLFVLEKPHSPGARAAREEH